MKKNYVSKTVIVFSVLVMLFGCAGLPHPEEMKAQTANFKLPGLPEEGKAIVYVVNPSTFAKHASKSGYMFGVFLDDRDAQSEVGATLGQQYTYFGITPGEHTIYTKAGNWGEINVSAKAGDIIFLQQEPYMGFTTLNIRLLKLQDYEGRYYVKTLPPGKIIGGRKTVAAAPANAPAGGSAVTQAVGVQPEKAAYTGIVEKCRFVKPFGFRWIINFKMEVRDDNGGKDIFYIWRNSKIVDADGKDIPFDNISARMNGQRVEIEHFVIEDDKGGYPDGSGFSYEVGQKGVRTMRFPDWRP